MINVNGLTLTDFHQLVRDNPAALDEQAVQFVAGGLQLAQVKEVKDKFMATVDRATGGNHHVGGQDANAKRALADRFFGLCESFLNLEGDNSFGQLREEVGKHSLKLGDVRAAFSIGANHHLVSAETGIAREASMLKYKEFDPEKHL